MDRVELGIKLDQINRLRDRGEYSDAARVCDTIDWRKVKKWSELSVAQEVYEKAERLKESRNICVYAYNRNLGGKRLLFKLTELSIMINDLEEADDLYREFIEAAPRDMERYVLLYKLNRARGVSNDRLIDILEEYKRNELDEQYEYELARLYAEVGRIDDCIRECDDLILWFSDGEYVEKALRLKAQHAELTKSQKAKLCAMEELGAEGAEYEAPISLREEEPSAYASSGRTASAWEKSAVYDTMDIQEDEIRVPEKDYSIYDTQNIQAELAKSMAAILQGDAAAAERASADAEKAHAVSPEEVFVSGGDDTEDVEEQADACEVEQIPMVESLYNETAYITEPEPEETEYIRVDEPTKEIRINTHHWKRYKSYMVEDEETAEAHSDEGGLTEAVVTEPEEEPEPPIEEPKEEPKASTEGLLEKPEPSIEDSEEEPKTSMEELVEELEPSTEEAEEEPEPSMEEPKEELKPSVEEPEKELKPFVEKPKEEPKASTEKPEEGLKPSVEEPEPPTEELAEEPEPSMEEPKEELKASTEKPAQKFTPDLELSDKTDSYSSNAEVKVSGAVREMPEKPEIASAPQPAVSDNIVDNEIIDGQLDIMSWLETEAIAEAVAETEAIAGAVAETEAIAIAGAVAETEAIAEAGARTETEAEQSAEQGRADTVAEPEPEEPLPTIEEAEAETEVDKSVEEVMDEMTRMLMEEVAQDMEAREKGRKPSSVSEEEYVATSEQREEAPSEIYAAETGPDGENAPEAEPAAETAATREPEEYEYGDPDDEDDGDNYYVLKEAERKYLRRYLFINGLESQVAEIINGKKREVRDNTSVRGNIVILGKPRTDKKAFAIDLFKAMHAGDGAESLKIARTTAAIINRNGIKASADKIRGMTLIIENVGQLTKASVRELCEFMSGDTDSMLVMLTGENYAVKRIFTENPDFERMFDYVVEIRNHTVNEFVALAKEYSKSKGYLITDKALLKLYLMVDGLSGKDDSAGIEGVRNIVDNAIERCGKKPKKSGALIRLKKNDFAE